MSYAVKHCNANRLHKAALITKLRSVAYQLYFGLRFTSISASLNGIMMLLKKITISSVHGKKQR